MSSKWIKRIIGLVVLALVVAAAVYALMPKPIPVDLATIDQGPLEVTVDEEGIARIKDVFIVSAPVAGHLDRLPVDVGDPVFRNTTLVASIHPVDPAFLDIRTRRELEAAAEAARAAVVLAQAQVAGAESAERLAKADLERAQSLAKGGTISARAFERAIADVDSAEAALAQSKATLELRKSELVSAEARLIEPSQMEGGSGDQCCLSIRAPVDGIVLKLVSQSEQVVAAGTELLEIGDPKELEIIVHLLSEDAANLAPGANARLDGWGGPALSAKLRTIDPAAFTKVSALGIEEQRVDAILDIVDPYEVWKKLGHDFRVMVHITTWQGENVVRVPLGALFRKGSEWSVFRVVDGKAMATVVELGHRNNAFAEVTKGLSAGDAVVLHPSDKVADGVAVEARETE